MYKEVLRSIEGIEIYPVISLIIFLLFFAILIYWFIKVDKKYLNDMSNIPLEEDKILKPNSTGKNHE
jgi:cytochrome c oxidase cbb3-type subunit 4